MQLRKLLFSDILKQNKEKPRCSLYIGLNLHGGSISDLKIEGGENPEDYHVTLVYGLFNPRSDIDDTVCRIQSVMEVVPKLLPRSLAFFHEHRFEASESSDGKDVIVAKVAHHALDQAHKTTLEALKQEKINLELTFPEYVPHMTLAYIEPDADYELRSFNKVGYIRDITVCIKDNVTHEKLYKRVYEVARTFSQLMKHNPYHDELGRFTTASGGGAIPVNMNVPDKYQSLISKVSGRDIEAVTLSDDERGYSDDKAVQERQNTHAAFESLTAKDYSVEYEQERIDKKMQQLSQKFNGKKNRLTGAYTKEQYEADVAELQKEKSKLQKIEDERNAYNETFIRIAQSEGFSMSKSPYGESYYAFPKGNSIDWGEKPEGSYRLSDHWNWTSEGSTHCPTADGKNYGKAICKMVNGKYELVMQLKNDVGKSYDMDNNSHFLHSSFKIEKADADKRLVFGWALVSATKEGNTIIDHQGDIVDQEDLEEGAYEYVLNFRDAGEEHIGTLRKKARMVESVVFTEEKLNAMGIPKGTVPIGWWIGFYVDDDTTWERIKDGTYQMFSIEGKAIREPVKDPVTKSGAKSFVEMIEKFNPYHDSLGRFTTGGSATFFTYKPGASKAHDLAIEREKQKHAAGTSNFNPQQNFKAARPKEATPRIKELHRIEDKIRKQDFESAAVVDDNGKQLLFKDGQRAEVRFSPLECRMMKDATLTHNHPRCSMFSYEDLNCMNVNGMKEIRATNRDGTTYSMKRADTGYSADKAREFAEKYKKQYLRGTMQAQRDLDSRGFQDKIWKGEITHDEANREFGRSCAKYMSDWASENAPNYGLVFTVEQTTVSTSTMKSWRRDIMKADIGKDDIVLDRETNELEDKAFNEWLVSHGLTENQNEERTAKSFSEIVKFNPYHDARGRFTFADGRGGISFFTTHTKDPNKQHWADKAVARQKEREAAKKPGSEFGLTPEQHEKLERQLNGSRFSALSDKTRRELGMSDEDFEKYKAKYKSEERRKQIEQEKLDLKRKEEEQKREQQRQFDERIKQELPGLSQSAIDHANSASFYQHGTNAAREALSRLDSYRERNQPKDDYTDEQKSYLKQREEEYKQLLTEYYNDSNQRWGDNPGWHVTGPARYNVNRYERKEQAARNKAAEYEEKLKRFEENTNKRIKSMDSEEKQIAYWRNGKYGHGEKIDPADPLAEKKYQAKIDFLKESNEKAKAANKYWNKNHDMSGFDGFSEETNQKLNAQFQRIYSGNLNSVRSPFSTTNNSAEIRRNEAQLKQLQQRKATASSPGGGGTTFNGGQIIRNTDANRLQIKFDGIPDAATRQQLKSSGWRWSPKNGVWQRQLTDNAERSAKQITDSLNKSYYSETAKSFSELMKFNPYHDRLGRFTTGGGFGVGSSFYTGDKSRQAVTFSANPDTVAGRKAIERHGGVVPTAFDMKNKPQTEEKPKTAKKPKEAPKPKVETDENGFAPAKTKQEAVEYAKTKLGFESVDYGDIGIEAVNHINQEITAIQKKFPELANVKDITLDRRQGVYAAAGTSHNGRNTFYIGNAKYGAGIETVKQSYQKDVNSGFHPAGTDYKSIIWHEYGHMYAYTKFKTGLGFAANETLGYWDGADYVKGIRGRTYEKGIIRDAAKSLKISQKELKSRISRYAEKNPAETFAEAFAEYHNSENPRPECVAMMKAAGIAK